MFKLAPLLILLLSAGLLTPLSASASGACVNPDVKPLKATAVETPAAIAASEAQTANDSKKPSVPLIAGQADELKAAADNFKTRYPKTKVLAYRLTPLS